MKNAGRGRQSTASKSRPIGSRSCSPSPLRMMNGAELPAPHGYPVRLIAPGGASLVPPAAVWPLAGSGIGFPAAGKETLSEEVLSTGTTMSTREVRQGLSGGQDTLQRQMHHWLLSAPIGFDRVRCELQLRVHD